MEYTTGHHYPGGHRIQVYRPLPEVPIFVRPGTIIPLDGAARAENGCPLPETLLFRIFAGASGSCRVLEDNGKAEGSPDRNAVETRCVAEVRDSMTVMISPPIGDKTLIPEKRRYTLELVGVDVPPDDATCAYESSYNQVTRSLRLTLAPDALTGATLRWHKTPTLPILDRKTLFRDALLPLRMNNDDKDRVMQILKTAHNSAQRIAAWRCLNLPDSVLGRLMELDMLG